MSTLAGNAAVFASSLVYAKDRSWNTQRAHGKTTFEGTPGWRAALQVYVDMKNADCFGPGVAEDTAASTLQQFSSGQSAMLTANDGYLAPVRALNPKLQFNQFVFPSTSSPSTTYMTLFPSDTLVVNAHSHDSAAADAFVAFVARPAETAKLNAILGNASPLEYARVLNPKIGAKALDANHRAFAPYVKRIIFAGTATWASLAPLTAMGTAAQGLFTGQDTVDQVLQATDTAWPK